MIDFPSSPTDGQLFVASNGVTYAFSATPAPGLWQATPTVVETTGSGKYVLQDTPVLTGSPTAPTPPAGDRSQRIATTGFLGQVVPLATIGAGYAVSGSAGSYVTPPLVSAQAYMIREAFKTPDKTTVSIHLQQKPSVVPTQLVVRTDNGWNGVTYGEHPATSPIGTPWNVVVGSTPYIFELLGSTWVDGSPFKEGHCYVPGTIFDASIEINNMLEWCRASGGPTFVQLPPGMMYVKNEVIRIPEGVTFQGYGMRVTGLFWCDAVDEPSQLNSVIGTGSGTAAPGVKLYGQVFGTTLADFCVYGNRERKRFNVGTHAISLGRSDEPGLKQSITLRRVASLGSHGYGIALEGGLKDHVLFDSVLVSGSSGDGYDYKDFEDNNAHFRWLNCEVHDWALYTIGTNYPPLITLPPNSIKIKDVPTTDFSIPRTADLTTPQPPPALVGYPGLNKWFQRGFIVTLSGVAPIDGVDFNGSWHCVGNDTDDDNRWILRHTSTLIANTAGAGGTTISAFAPSPSSGDVPIDIRSGRTILENVYVEGNLIGRGGLRQRVAAGPRTRAVGGMSNIWTACVVKDTSPDWINDIVEPTIGTAFVMQSGEGTMINPTFFGMGRATGIYVTSGARSVQIISPRIHNAMIGAILTGEKINLSGGIIEDSKGVGILVHGAVVGGELQPLPEDPFVPVAIGSNVVHVNSPNHGLSSGDLVSFRGFVNDPANGLVIESAVTSIGNYAVTPDGQDFYYIAVNRAVAGAALTTDPFGGDSAEVFTPRDYDHVAHDIHISDVSIYNSDVGNSSVGIDIGTNIYGNDYGQADNITVSNCHNNGSFIPFVNYGTNVTLGPGNTGGIPNVPDGLPNDDEPCWELIKEIAVTPGTEASFYDFHDIDYQEIRLEGIEITHDTAGNIALSLSSNDCATLRNINGDSGRAGASRGTNAIVLVGSTVAGSPGKSALAYEITNFNTKRRTYIRGDGGQLNASSPVNELAYETGPRCRFLIRYGGDPTIPGSHAISSIILGGTALISAPVPYVVTTVTAAAWDTTLKQFLFTTATPHLIVANEQMRVMAMTPASYNGVFSVIAVTPTTITAVYVSGIVPIPEPPAAATGMGVISDPNTTAANIAAAINANVPTQQMYSSVSYTSTSTAYVVIYEAMPYEYLYGSSTGRALAVSVTGDFTVTNIDDEMDTTIFNSFRVALSAGNFSSGTKFRVYQKGG